MARVTINFIGLWRLVLGVRTATAEITTIDEARDYVETHYGPCYQKRLSSKGIKKQQSIWDNSAVLLNGRTIKQLETPALKDGDTLDLLPIVAGG